MGFFSHFCICALFFLVSVTPLQAAGETCSVDRNVLNILENNAAGLVVTNITAAPDITVKIEHENGTKFQWFEIKGSQLILKYSVDFENITVLTVQLTCSRGDIKVNSLAVVVTIENVNDNPPIFKETNITINVTEDTKVNTIVVPQANVTATDADLDVIYYRLTGNPTEATQYFNIQGVNNPQITLLKTLDYEQLNFMVLTLYAMDGNVDAPGTHTATATINIHVFQADLRPPWFQPCTPIPNSNILCLSHGYTGAINISEKVTDPLTLKPGPLYAIDGDKILNEKIVYEIASGNDDNTFVINKDSGNITMNKPANSLNTFLLYVVASQVNNPLRYSQTTVEIQVIHQSNHTPQFEKNSYTGRVSVDQPVSSLIMEANTPSVPLRIFAADDDFPDKVNPFIKYSIQNSTDFRVTTDGLLLTTVVLTQASKVTLLAIAKDTMDLQEASTVIIVDVTPLANLPTTPSGHTNSTTPPTSTTNSGITGTTGKPVTVTTSSSGTPPFLTTVKPPNITESSQPTVGTDKPTVGTDKPTDGTDKPTVGTDKPIDGTDKPTDGTDKPTVGTDKPTVGTDKPTDGTDKPTVGTDKPTVGTDKPTDGTDKPTDGTDKPTVGTDKPTLGTDKPTVGTDKPTLGTDKPSQTAATQLSTTDIKPTTGGTIQSTSPTFKPTISKTTSATTLSSRPSTQMTSTPSGNEHTTANPVYPQMSSTTLTTGVNAPSTYTAQDMAALGATLGCLLAIAFVLLGVISYKNYKIKRDYGEGNYSILGGFINANFKANEKPNSDEKGSLSPPSAVMETTLPVTLASLENSLAAATAFDTIVEGNEESEDSDSQKEVKSILTKDRKVEDDGYKAVWFKDDIDPEAGDDVKVIEDDSDTEGNRNDNADDESSDGDDDDNGNDSGRGSSNSSIIPGRVRFPGAEESSIYL